MGDLLLVIDYGTSTVKAGLATAGKPYQPVLFDGMPWLSSAIHIGQTGPQPVDDTEGLAGELVYPLSALTEEHLTIVGATYDPAELIAVTLRHVQAVAAQQAGYQPDQIILVVAARRGPRWRTALRCAAHHAGITQTRLVDAPTAVATHLLGNGMQLPDGSTIAVCDLGASATEVTVLQRLADQFETLAIADTDTISGNLIDQQLAEKIDNTIGQATSDHDIHTRTGTAQQIKHALAHSVIAHLPSPDGTPTTVNQLVLHEVTDPLLPHLTDLIEKAARDSNLDPTTLAGVYLLGGGAQLPGLTDHLRRSLTLPTVTVPEPQTAAARAAATSQPDTVTAGPSPANRTSRIPFRGIAAAVLPLLASLLLLRQTLTQAAVFGKTYYWPGEVVAAWSAIGLAGLCVLIACTATGQLIARYLTAARGPAHLPGRGADIVTGSIITGLAAAITYAMIADIYFAGQHPPILPIALWSTGPAAVILIAGAQLPRWKPVHLELPPTSATLTAVAGMMTLTAGLSGQITLFDLQTPLWTALTWLGGILIGIAFALLATRKTIIRLCLAAALGIAGLAIADLSTRNTLGYTYIAATTAWLLIHTSRKALTSILNPTLGHGSTSD